LAEPGEFTLRAFLAGRLDLTQAEAILGLIDANSATEFSMALSQAAGGLADPFRKLRSELLDLLADLEAALDFADEDIEFISKPRLLASLRSARDLAATLQTRIDWRGTTTKAIRVAIVGNPNVGKSSLFNALQGNAAAIVSPISGTTRDYLTAQIIFRGHPIELIDTAGLEAIDGNSDGESGQFVHVEAQSKTHQQLNNSDIVLYCLDSSRRLDNAEHFLLNNRKSNWIIVATKVDCSSMEISRDWVRTSSLDGTGLERLLQILV
jgi:tRNA modification GTPase